MLQHELDKVEELRVEHLAVDHELRIVSLNHAAEPLRHVRLNVAGLHMDDLFFLGAPVKLDLPNWLFKLLLVDKHVGRPSPGSVSCVCDILLVLGQGTSVPSKSILL